MSDQRRREVQRLRDRRLRREQLMERLDWDAWYDRHILPYPHACRGCGAQGAIGSAGATCTSCGWSEAGWLARSPC